MRQARLLRIVLIALVVLGLILLTAPSAATTASGFQTRDDVAAGQWRWLDQEGAAAAWTFDDPNAPPRITGASVEIDALVTNRRHGGSGHDKHLLLTLASGERAEEFEIFLDNPAPLGKKAKRMNKGYRAHGLLASDEISASDRQRMLDVFREYAATGQLRVSYTFAPTAESCCPDHPEEPHVVAVHRDSVRVYFAD